MLVSLFIFIYLAVWFDSVMVLVAFGVGLLSFLIFLLMLAIWWVVIVGGCLTCCLGCCE